MNYSALATEIALPQYNGMTDTEIAVSLSSVEIRVRQPVVVAVLVNLARELQITLALRTVSLDNTKPVALRAVCQEILSLMDGDLAATIDLDNPTAIAMFMTLLQYGIMNAEQSAAVDALATARIISRAEQIGLGTIVSVEDIERCRIVPQLEALRIRLAKGYNDAVTTLDATQAVPEWTNLIAVIEAA